MLSLLDTGLQQLHFYNTCETKPFWLLSCFLYTKEIVEQHKLGITAISYIFYLDSNTLLLRVFFFFFLSLESSNKHPQIQSSSFTQDFVICFFQIRLWQEQNWCLQ